MKAFYLLSILLFVSLVAVGQRDQVVRCQLGDIKDSTASVKEVLQAPQLYVLTPKNYYNGPASVFSFKLSVVNASQDSVLKEDRSKGNRLSISQKDVIAKLTSGSKIIFSNIYITTPDGHPVKLYPFWIYIK